MKRLKFILTLFIASFSIQSNAGIPVIDGTNLTQQILQVTYALEQIAQLVEQVNTAKDQLTKATDTLESMQGVRGMASVLSSAYDPSVSVTPSSILSSNGLSDSATLGISGATASLYDTANNFSAKYLGQTEKTLQQSQARFSEIMKLVAKVNDAPDQKDVLDLQARIGAENAMLQNEMIKLSALRAQNESNEGMLLRQRSQVHLQYSGKSSDVHF